MASEGQIRQKFGGNLVDEVVKSKSAINSHWKDDKGKQVSRNIEKIQKQFDEFYKETTRLFIKLEQVEKQAQKADWSGVAYKDGWGEKLAGGGDDDHFTITNKNADVGEGIHITSKGIHHYIGNEGNYEGSDF